MLKLLSVFVLLAIAGCSIATQKLNEHTGTTLAQRCADRQAFIAGVDIALANGTQVADDVMTLYGAYKAFVSAYCLPSASTADAEYARRLIAEDGSATVAEWLASGTLKERYQAALAR